MKKLKMTPHNTNGLLLTVCGLDGCGKSTIIKMLKEQLEKQGKTVVLTKQPTDMVRKSGIFRQYMDCENHGDYSYRALSLFAASDRVQHSNKEILPELEKGNIVISDRYFYSCLANLRGRGYRDDNWIYEISEFIPKPDIAFFLDVPVELAINRVRSRPEEKDRYIDVHLQHSLRAEYKAISKQNNGVVIASDRPAESTFEEVWKYVAKKLNEKERG